MKYYNFKEKFLYQLIDLMERSRTLGPLRLVLEGLPGESVTLNFLDGDVYCPLISVEEMYLRNQYEMLPVRELAAQALKEFQIAEASRIRLKMDIIRNPIFVKLCAVNSEKRVVLEALELPYIEFGDICIYYRYHARREDGKIVYEMPVEKEDLYRWNLNAEELFSFLSKNTVVQAEVQIRPMSAVIQKTLGHDAMVGRPKQIVEQSDAWILTGPGGAAGVFYNYVLAEFAEKVKTSFYVLPTSIEEASIYAADTYTLSDMIMRQERKGCLSSNLSFHPLSNVILYYDQQKKNLKEKVVERASRPVLK